MNASFGIIFDFNGVMLDDYTLQKEAWNRISEIVRGQPVTDEEMTTRVRGIPTRDTVIWMAGGKLDEAEIKKLDQQKNAFIRALFKTAPLTLTKGLEALLDDIQKHDIPCTIATSQTQDVFEVIFERLGLAKWFRQELVVCFDGTYPGKPAPDPYLLAAKKLSLPPSECIVFEDARAGIQSAHAAGVRTIIAVTRPEAAATFQKLPGVVKVIQDFSEINLEELQRLQAA